MKTTHPTSLSPVVAAAFVGAVVSAPLVLGATAAHADPGTIKVHAEGTPFEKNANEPKQACTFYIAAFGATANQTYRVTFAPQAANGNGPAGTPTTASDTYPTDKNLSKNGKKGDGRSRLFNEDPGAPEILPGQYKVTVVNVNDSGDRKTKVFRVGTCESSGSGGGTPTPTPTPTPSPTPAPGDEGTSGNEGGEDNPGEVGGVEHPPSSGEDNGATPVGGVATGGGGLAAGGDGAGALPWALLGGTGLIAGSLAVRKLRK